MHPGDILRDSPEEVAVSAADLVEQAVLGAVKQRGVARVALSGGKSPSTTYRELARRSLPRDKIHWFWVDERCVPPSSERSNYAMAVRELLKPMRIHPSNIMRMEGEIEPQLAAERYANVLRREFCAPDSPPESGVPTEDVRFDALIAGVGSDGHTGSLFPGTGAVREVDQLVTVVDPGGRREKRLTLTRPVILNARRIIVIALGAKKREVLTAARTFGTEDELPARIYLGAMPGTVSWVLDQEAAGSPPRQRSFARVI